MTYRTLAVTRKALVPLSLALLLLLQLLLLELLGLFGGAGVCVERIALAGCFDVRCADAMLGSDVLSSLSLPMARGALA
jgi:hypothetical protein